MCFSEIQRLQSATKLFQPGALEELRLEVGLGLCFPIDFCRLYKVELCSLAF